MMLYKDHEKRFFFFLFHFSFFLPLASQEDCVHFLSFGAKHKNAVRSVWRNREFRKLFFHFFGFSADVTDSAGRSANGATFLTEKINFILSSASNKNSKTFCTRYNLTFSVLFELMLCPKGPFCLLSLL